MKFILDLNEKTQVWLEFGPMNGLIPKHDTRLDCGASTYVEAIINKHKDIC